MEAYTPISFLNDFIFCPRSIYFHQLYGNVSTQLYHSTDQINGLTAHKTVDGKTYSHRTSILQGLEVYSEKYQLCGKIDILDVEKKLLSERKKKIKVVYDGYIFQLYAQYFCLIEMGYSVEVMKLYSMDDNKSYPITLPENDTEKLKAFEELIKRVNSFNLDHPFSPNANKCGACIYNNLCDYSVEK